jgi:predicted RNA-binding protein with PUA-like domain
MVLVNNSRLSVQPVRESEFMHVLRLAGEPAPK